jgi:hypothetical protein
VVEMTGIAETYHFSQLERVHPEHGGAKVVTQPHAFVARSRSAACSLTDISLVRGVPIVSGSARAVAARTKIVVGRRAQPQAARQATPPHAQVTARPRRASQALGPGLRPRPLGSWNPCTRPAVHLSDGPRAPTPATVARRRGRACPPGQTPASPPGTAPVPLTRRHSTEAGLQATPARPRAPKPSQWNDQRSRSWPLRLGAASSPRRARSQSDAESDAPHTILIRADNAHHSSPLAPVADPSCG